MPNSTIDELSALVKKQTEALARLEEDNKKIKRRLFFMVLGSNIRLLIFLVPLILALVYVVPFFKDNWKQMQSLLSITGMQPPGGTMSLFDQLGAQGVNVSQLLQQLQQEQQ